MWRVIFYIKNFIFLLLSGLFLVWLIEDMGRDYAVLIFIALPLMFFMTAILNIVILFRGHIFSLQKQKNLGRVAFINNLIIFFLCATLLKPSTIDVNIWAWIWMTILFIFLWRMPYAPKNMQKKDIKPVVKSGAKTSIEADVVTLVDDSTQVVIAIPTQNELNILNDIIAKDSELQKIIRKKGVVIMNAGQMLVEQLLDKGIVQDNDNPTHQNLSGLKRIITKNNGGEYIITNNYSLNLKYKKIR